MSMILEGIAVCTLYCGIWVAQECTTWDCLGLSDNIESNEVGETEGGDTLMHQ